MKKWICMALALLWTGCAALAEPVELTVFAAASLTEALTQLADMYRAVEPDVSLAFNFDSSGTLQTQIEEGAPCDLFLSAAETQMDALAAQGLIVEDSRVDLLENRVALAVPDGNPAEIQRFADVAGAELVAIGNADVPVGAYAVEILENLGLMDGLVAGNHITYGGNVKEVVSQIEEGVVDCGIVYTTDAASAELTVVDVAGPELCGRALYPAAMLADSAHPEAARALLDWLTGPEAARAFEQIGFAVIAGER